jgi:hypothetical protein
MVARLLVSELAATMSFGVLSAALGWQAYSRTGDPLVLGLIGLFEFLPALVLAVPAGQLADRVDRRYVTAAGNLGAFVFTGLLLLDAAAGGSEAWPLYLLAAALARKTGFSGPTTQRMRRIRAETRSAHALRLPKRRLTGGARFGHSRCVTRRSSLVLRRGGKACQ